MKLSIYTQIFPRLETFFVDEWIKYHLKLGVDHIYIYDNGLKSTESPTDINYKIENEFKGTKWAKKPNADYFLDYSDDEIYDHLYEIIKKYKKQVTLKTWRPNKECPHYERIYCQCHGYLNCINNHDRNTWWIHIDPDEYLFSEKHDLKKFISFYETKKYFSLKLRQRVFESRKRNISVKSLCTYGYDIDIFKCIVKLPNLNSQMDLMELAVRNSFIHDVESTSGKSIDIPFNEFRINHYRGEPTSGNMHIKFVSDNNIKFNKIDKSFNQKNII